MAYFERMKCLTCGKESSFSQNDGSFGTKLKPVASLCSECKVTSVKTAAAEFDGAGLQYTQETVGSLGEPAKREIIYLASPYSSPSKVTRQWRARIICGVAARLIQDGLMVYSPIAHTHAIGEVGKLPTDFEYWKEFDTRMLSACDKLVVVKMVDWNKSLGIKAEITIAKELGKPIEYIEVLPTLRGGL